jgi:uncharacterized protein YjiK
MQGKRQLLFAALVAASLSAHAADSINLGNYRVSATYSLATDIPGSTVSGLEASAVTYARDRGTLFFVGDEGTGVIEITLSGQTLGSMAFDWTGTASTNNDTEGLTYLGGGVLVVGEERLFDAYQFSYAAGGTARLADSYVSISNATVGNDGMEGISYDPRDGSFVAVKQQSPQDVLAGGLTFAGGAGGTSTMATLFNPAPLGLTSLSDVQTLSPVDALAGTPAADNLLLLSLGSRSLAQVDRDGNIKSSFDLSAVLPDNGIEGVTVDENGIIYLIAEHVQNGALSPIGSQLIVLTPVPEPASVVSMLAGLGLLGFAVRYRRRR